MISPREQAAFEAGIKLGALYHQWVGTPVSRDTAASLEQAMEKSVALQPYVESVRVRLVRERITPNPYGYGEVRGDLFEVSLVTRIGKTRCHTGLSFEGEYPLMSVRYFEEGGTGP